MTADPDSAFRGRKVCVTGGAGFIGSHLVDALVEHGAAVCVLDDLTNGLERNLVAAGRRVRLIRGSILDPVALSDALHEAEVVFHLAALTSVTRSVKEPKHAFEVNATGTLRVLEACRAAGVERLVNSSSSSAYGDRPEPSKSEAMRPDPLSPYAAAKCCGEHLLRAYAHCYDLHCVSLRYFNIFGPRQRADSPYSAVIPIFAEAMRAGRRPRVYGDGSQTRDFTFVANAVHANLLAASTERPLRGEVINIACGQSYSVLQLVERMAALLGVPADVEFAPARTGEVLHSRADIATARETLGYEVVVDFDEGLQRTLGPA